MKIALVSPPLRAYNQGRLPIGLAMLAATVKDQYTVRIFEPVSHVDLPQTLFHLASEIIAWEPDVVGFTCTTPDYPHVCQMATIIKSTMKDVWTLVGGAHPTVCPMDFEHQAIDTVCRGEGERIFPDLMTRRPDCWLVAGDPVTDLDSLPLPAYDLLDMRQYLQPRDSNIRPLLLSGAAVFTSRGCPYDCAFCAAGTVHGRQVRYRSPAKVVEEIKLLRSYGADSFFVYDETFTANQIHAIGICQAVKTLNMPWGCQTRVNHLTSAMAQELKQAGCVQVELGVEAGNAKGWKILDKRITRAQVLAAFAYAREAGLRSLANFMVNVPGETKEDLDDLQALMVEINPTACLVNILTPYPGTAIGSRYYLPHPTEYLLLSAHLPSAWYSFLEGPARLTIHTESFQQVQRRLYQAWRMASPWRLGGLFDSLGGWWHLWLIMKSRWSYPWVRVLGRRLRIIIGEVWQYVTQR